MTVLLHGYRILPLESPLSQFEQYLQPYSWSSEIEDSEWLPPAGGMVEPPLRSASYTWDEEVERRRVGGSTLLRQGYGGQVCTSTRGRRFTGQGGFGEGGIVVGLGGVLEVGETGESGWGFVGDVGEDDVGGIRWGDLSAETKRREFSSLSRSPSANA